MRRELGMAVRTAVDAGMIVLLPLLMGYSLVGQTLHEWLGVALLLLAAAHLFLNRRAIPALFRGKMSPARVLRASLDLLLLADLLATGVSGVMLSKHLFTFLPSGGAALARRVHLPLAYWGFVLAGLHLGGHGEALAARARTLRGGARGGAPLWAARAAVLAGAVYGAIALVRRRFLDYLFLREAFVFYDFGEPLALYLIDMAAILVLFAAVGYALARLLGRVGRAREG